jgi:hypothetical protein
MSTMLPPGSRSPSSLTLVDPVEAHAVVEAFFDALGHFAGEGPTIEELARVLAPDAEIVDGAEGEEDDAVRFGRDAWLAHLDEGSAQDQSADAGHFFEEVERVMTASDRDLRVGSVVEERWTQGGVVEAVDTLHCELVISRVGDHASIVQVTVRRSSRPPPR